MANISDPRNENDIKQAKVYPSAATSLMDSHAIDSDKTETLPHSSGGWNEKDVDPEPSPTETLAMRPSAQKAAFDKYDLTNKPAKTENQLRPLLDKYRWRPSFWRARPLIGLAAIAVVIGCLVSCLIVLTVSSGDEVSTWSFQPTVYLAILTAISNTALQCALAQAAPISWWYKAFKSSTVLDLELDYEAGQSFPRAFIMSAKYRRMCSLFSLASFATAFVLIDGPLLQRASSVRRTTTSHNVNMTVPLAQTLHAGFSGTQLPMGAVTPSTPLIGLIARQMRNKPIVTNAFCNGSCTATVKGPGLATVNCRRQDWNVNEDMLRTGDLTWGIGAGIPGMGMASKPLVYAQMATGWDICYDGREPVFLATGAGNWQDCHGKFVFANCTMVPAIVEYEVVIQGHEISFASPASKGNVVAILNNTCSESPPGSWKPVTMGVFVDLMIPYLSANASLGAYYAVKPGVRGPLEPVDMNSFNPFSVKYFDDGLDSNSCNVATRDPRNDIVAQLNEIMFRSGIEVASWHNITKLVGSDLAVNQTVHTYLTKDENVFHSDMRWFLGAASVQILTILLILPTYWGWWKVGVDLSLSPFHTAKALNAPLLRDVNSVAGATGILDKIGDLRLRYGALYESESPDFAKGAKPNLRMVSRSRVGLAEADRVSEPMKGARFDD